MRACVCVCLYISCRRYHDITHTSIHTNTHAHTLARTHARTHTHSCVEFGVCSFEMPLHILGGSTSSSRVCLSRLFTSHAIETSGDCSVARHECMYKLP